MGWDDPNADPATDLANYRRWLKEDYLAVAEGRTRPPRPLPATRQPEAEEPERDPWEPIGEGQEPRVDPHPAQWACSEDWYGEPPRIGVDTWPCGAAITDLFHETHVKPES